jgi:hypothetical protein
LATDALARQRHETATPSAEDDARAIDAIERAIREQGRARSRRRAIIAAVAIVSCAAGIGAVRIAVRETKTTAPAVATTNVARAHVVAGTVLHIHDGHAEPMTAGTTLGAGDRLVAPADGRASVVLATGTQMLVENGADFGVAELGDAQRFVLAAGAVRADVAKLALRERFVVRTVDAEIEVRGTSFRVAVVSSDPTCGGGVRTRVVVAEGTVVVRSGDAEDRVAAGESWPRGCSVVAPPVATTVARIENVPPPPRPQPPAPSAAPPSDIGEQTRLLSEAADARRRGAMSDAVARYDAYLARFPAGQGVEGATVERMRLLATMDRARGAAAARAYLARFPQGYARSEASELAAGAP